MITHADTTHKHTHKHHRTCRVQSGAIPIIGKGSEDIYIFVLFFFLSFRPFFLMLKTKIKPDAANWGIAIAAYMSVKKTEGTLSANHRKVCATGPNRVDCIVPLLPSWQQNY